MRRFLAISYVMRRHIVLAAASSTSFLSRSLSPTSDAGHCDRKTRNSGHHLLSSLVHVERTDNGHKTSEAPSSFFSSAARARWSAASFLNPSRRRQYGRRRSRAARGGPLLGRLQLVVRAQL